MAEPHSGYEKLRRAAHELGERDEYLVQPVEEGEDVAAAAADEAPVPELAPGWPERKAGVEPAAGRKPPERPVRKPGGWPWRSPVEPADVARGVDLRVVSVDARGTLWWLETRPSGGGHLLRRDAGGETVQLSAVEAAEAVPVPGGVVVAGHLDGQLYLLRPPRHPLPLTSDPGARHFDLVAGPDGREVWCVRESAVDARSLVAVPLDPGRPVRTLVATGAFLAAPRPSPDGSLLAWIEWDRPQMPWDGSRLRVGRLGPEKVTQAWTLLGGPAESVFQPEWASGSSLYAVSDRTRWWNLYEVSLDGALRPVCLSSEEFGWPQTAPGLASYGALADGRLAALHGCGGWRLDLLDPKDGTLVPLDLPYTAWQPTVRTGGNLIAAVAGSPTRPAGIVVVDATTGKHEVVRQPADVPEPGYLPEARSTTFVARDGHEVRAVVYPPRHPRSGPAEGERVPYLLFLYDGPGTQMTRMLDLTRILFTSRGFGVAAVDCRGSSGYGRAYREQVYGQWGVADVEDCAVAARGLVRHWRADPARLVVRGSGAGGTLALEALADTDLFAAATVYAPVTDLDALPTAASYGTADYLRAIAADSAPPRSPSWLGHIDRPVLVFHGERDSAVPVAQTVLLREALRRRGIPHTCITFPGEGHTFGAAGTITQALDAELLFYTDVLGYRS